MNFVNTSQVSLHLSQASTFRMVQAIPATKMDLGLMAELRQPLSLLLHQSSCNRMPRRKGGKPLS